MKIVAIIPARYASERLPRKLMLPLGNRTVLQRTYEAVKNSNLFDEVWVACDHEELEESITSMGGLVYRSQQEHASGSDRIAEAAKHIEADIIVNVQGDEPFIANESLQQVLTLFENSEVQVASLRCPITDLQEFTNPNCVKVVVSTTQKALYFSRAPIPYDRDGASTLSAYRHIGIYAYRRAALFQFTQWPASSLEQIEKLENLRLLENGMDIYLNIINQHSISIDTEADYQRALEHAKSLGWLEL